MEALVRTRATLSALGTTFAALFGFVPFLPRLVRAVFTGRRDRERMLELMREGLHEQPLQPPLDHGGAVRVFLVAGEPSGDLHGADLARALQLVNPQVRLEGIGGPKMAAAGVELIADLVSDPVMGVLPVLRKLPFFFGLYRSLLVRFELDPPDVFVGVDYPGLNIRLGQAARRKGIRTVEYIAPQVWAWAPWRCAKLARAFNRIIAILPFEPAVFEQAGGEAVYVGHPLFEHLAARKRDKRAMRRLRDRLGDGERLVALMPGSRRAEVEANFPLILDVARRVAERRAGTRFVVPLASERLRPLVEAALAASGLECDVSPPANSDDAMRAAHAAVSVSGTATLHLLANRTPAVICYRVGAGSRLLSKLLIVSPFIALPNLLAGHEVVPEFLASEEDAGEIAEALLPILEHGSPRRKARAVIRALTHRLDVPGVPERAARWVLATARGD